MNNSQLQQSDKAVAYWLLTGVIMIMIQVLIGGITRLTESGLSITEWQPFKGAIPPLSDAAWQAEFEKYRRTDQFKYIHADFTLSDFKFIFFWEWFHRVWARLLGVVFLVGFVYFLAKKRFKQSMVLPLVILFFLGAIQGAIGWIMVKSGLVPEKFFVGHVELATHFVAALVLLVYTFWFALQLLVPAEKQIPAGSLSRFTLMILVLLFVQLTYGGFMAGLKAASMAPTWPTINGEWWPATLFNKNVEGNYVNNPIMVHFIHRGLAYLLVILLTIWFIRAGNSPAHSLIYRKRWLPFLIALTQVVLGILTVLYSYDAKALLWFGVLHQFTAMILVMVLVWALYITRGQKVISV